MFMWKIFLEDHLFGETKWTSEGCFCHSYTSPACAPMHSNVLHGSKCAMEDVHNTGWSKNE